MDGYKKEMASIITKQLKADSIITSKWERYSSSQYLSLKSYSIGLPLMNTTWGQDNAYASDCPRDPNTNNICVAGCTAVSLAQILHYWGCKVFPDGTKTYTPKNFTNSLTVNFYDQDYDWDAMNHTSADADNVELIYHCGVAIGVDYTDSLTGGTISDAESAMKNYFGFQTLGVKWKDQFADNVWIGMLKNEINAGRPVFYGGIDSTYSYGHSWVIDGYDVNNTFHCNWGYSGLYMSTFYSLGSLNPNGINYTEGQGGIFGAEPILDACSGLTGADEVCSSSNESYSVTIPSTASVVWSRTGAVSQVGVNTNPTDTVSYGYNGEGTVTATIKNSHGQTFNRSKDVWAGEPHDLELYCEGRGMLYTYAFYVTPVYDYDSIVWGVYPLLLN